jgi:hypothetical protein
MANNIGCRGAYISYIIRTWRGVYMAYSMFTWRGVNRVCIIGTCKGAYLSCIIDTWRGDASILPVL